MPCGRVSGKIYKVKDQLVIYRVCLWKTDPIRFQIKYALMSWNCVKRSLIGKSLRLHCKEHGVYSEVEKKQDFESVMEGGCKNPCNASLECNHVCKKLCHVLDKQHVTIYKCSEPCKEKLKCGHLCTRTCHKNEDPEHKEVRSEWPYGFCFRCKSFYWLRSNWAFSFCVKKNARRLWRIARSSINVGTDVMRNVIAPATWKRCSL